MRPFSRVRSARCPLAAGLLLLLVSAAGAQGLSPLHQDAVDPGLARLIATTQAIDNHAHPPLPPSVDPTDRGFDALPVDNMAPETDPVAWRADNPQLPAAWETLWGLHLSAPPDAAAMAQLQAARSRVAKEQGGHFDDWVLDRAGIATEVANRVALGQGIAPPRFRWVPYDDALLFPLDNADLAAQTPDRGQFFPLEDRLRARYLRDSGLAQMPGTLPEYVAEVVLPTLRRQKAGGAVAIKFEVAYLRSFAFGDPTEAEAARVYARWIGATGKNSAAGPGFRADYKVLQDYLMRTIAAACGPLHLAVHFHTMAGAGAYFDVAGDNPLLLEPLFDDPRLRGTNFVMLHGGWPFVREAGALLQKPNVYLDLSQETLLFPAHTLATWLREWLETYPDKVLFGTDGYPYSDAMGWPESTWLASRNGRQALGIALTGMLRDGEISQGRAEAIAVGVLRGTAAKLYGLP